MRKLLTITLSTVVVSSCATQIERAQDICNQIGNPSPACVERQYNIIRAQDIAFQQRQMNKINSGPPLYPSQPPTESEYDRRARESEDQAKNNCEMSGGVFEKYGTSWTCGQPKVSSQPPRPPVQQQRPPNQQPSPPPDNTEDGGPIDSGTNILDHCPAGATWC